MEDFSTRLRKAVDMAGISIRELSSKSSRVNEHTIYSYISTERYEHNRNPHELGISNSSEDVLFAI